MKNFRVGIFPLLLLVLYYSFRLSFSGTDDLITFSMKHAFLPVDANQTETATSMTKTGSYIGSAHRSENQSSSFESLSDTRQESRLASHGKCKQANTISLQTVQRFSKYHQPLGDFLTGPGLNYSSSRLSRTAVCCFVATPTSKHFPHALQQLYRCWSWWRTHPDKQAVLVGPAHHRGFRPVQRPDLFTGMLEALTNPPGPNALQIVPVANVNEVMKKFSVPNIEHALIVQPDFSKGDGYALASPQHAQDLRTVLERPTHSSTRDWRTGCPTNNHTGLPRIAILNRSPVGSRRSLLNARVIATQLQHGLGGDEGPPRIPVVYFEKRTFAEQIQFWNEVDIVLSPHGAQLAGIPLLPVCGGVLEIFPTGYYMPFYFGSLAQTSGLAYSTLYLTETGDWEQDNVQAQKNQKTRFQTRSRNLCPMLETVVEGAQKMVEEWQSCCQQQ